MAISQITRSNVKMNEFIAFILPLLNVHIRNGVNKVWLENSTSRDSWWSIVEYGYIFSLYGKYDDILGDFPSLGVDYNIFVIFLKIGFEIFFATDLIRHINMIYIESCVCIWW